MKSWVLWLVIGAVLLVGGLVAIFNPFAATLTAQQIAAWLFLFGGIAQVVATIRSSDWGARIINLVLAVAYLWLGISLLGHPLAGILTLTVLVAIMFLVNGILKVLLSFTLRGTPNFWAVLLSGAISIALAIMVFANFPQSAAVLLGVLLAVELISTGAMMIAYALHLRDRPPVAR